MPAAKSSTAKKYTLVIVESPAKAKTINKYLGTSYKVTASMGHVIDLPKSRIGVKIEENFEPEYITVRGKGQILNDLKKLASNSKEVLIASDNDREGEAIALHIFEAIKKKYNDLKIQRIVFNEITKDAIVESIKNPRDIDITKVEAQKARRILDRLVGYKISPILWEKVKNGLSAGRVQSVALKVICEREAEIEKFIPQEYWTVNGIFQKNKKEFSAELFKIDDQKPELSNANDVKKLKTRISDAKFIVDSIQKSTKSVAPQAPFTTSKLQQTAATRFGFTSKKTMSIAQQLYEGIDMGSERVGLITYMRTDSTRISDVAINEVRQFIESSFKDDLPAEPNIYSKKTGAQDAHEAIRPTSVKRSPEDVKKYLTPDQYKLYSIIWERFVSSQMVNSVYSSESVLISGNNVVFKISNSKLITPGFNNVLNFLKSKETQKQTKLPELSEKESVDLKDIEPEQHFTQPPPRYTDASIVKFLEENGIGRPSTYAPTISTLIDRYYVVRKARQIEPTVLGKLINKIIVEAFPNIVNIDFTANLESQLDDIAAGKMERVKLLNDFYDPFKESLDVALKTLEDHKKAFDQETDEVCEKCGSKMIKKLGKFGFFLACSNFPACRNSKTIPLADCPADGCNGKIIPRKKGARGKEFYGCTNYPECQFVTWFKPTDVKCPKCGKFLVEKNDKVRGFYKACVDDNCGYKQIEDSSTDVADNES